MPRGKFFYCVTCHNLGPSLTSIMDDGDQYFKKIIIFMSKNLHSAMCQILIDGWQLIISAWHHECSYNGIA
jgi:hypothetical protein